MAERNLADEMETLREDMAKLRTDVTGIAAALKDLGKNRAEAAKASVGEAAQGLKDEVMRLLDDARGRGKRSIETVESEVADRPFLSLLVSFGAGLLLAKLLERK